MNKGLEVIEAHHLFGTPYERIDVVVHPQSIVHSSSCLCDGAALAHLGHPDMRVPIAYALLHPERVDVPVRALDLAEVGALTFEPVDEEAFPCLRLAREAALAGGTAPCVLNAANEVAVHAFLEGRLPFLGIPAVIERGARAGARRAGPRVRDALRGRPRGARGRGRADRGRRGGSSQRLLAFVGIAVLVILHELGHFTAAKAVGHARGEVLAVLRADDLVESQGRDGLRDRDDPARRLREDHRHEPDGGPRRRGRPAAPSTASRCGSGSSSSAPGRPSTSSSRSSCSPPSC